MTTCPSGGSAQMLIAPSRVSAGRPSNVVPTITKWFGPRRSSRSHFPRVQRGRSGIRLVEKRTRLRVCRHVKKAAGAHETEPKKRRAHDQRRGQRDAEGGACAGAGGDCPPGSANCPNRVRPGPSRRPYVGHGGAPLSPSVLRHYV